ncbi:NAD-dependent epimerase/dehydratase family protein [Azonexus caeni]|uniref:NAD-dependent epimerase/dehydratase family protein n=1 Tax=Azonexus caeni TaxID=266126 RepID=UPI003A84EDAE
MKYLVTGATSGLGRNAAEWLLAAGFKVRASGRDLPAGAALAARGAEFVPLDLALASPAECAALLDGIDALWHCAALSAPWGDPAAFQAANLDATRKLAAAAGERGLPRFVQVSTPSIYFDFQHRHEVGEEFRAARFANAYAASKYAAEQAIRELAARHPATRYTMLRPRALFGPHDRVILPRLLRQIERDGGVLRLPRGGAAVLDLTYVGNVVHALQLATTQPQLPAAAVYNISNHQPGRLIDLLDRLLRQEMGLAYRLQALPYPLLHGVAAGMEAVAALTRREPPLTRYSVGAVNFDMTLDNRRAIAELGYRPIVPLAEGIRRTAAWQRGKEAVDG